MLLGMRSCHTGIALLFGVGAVAAHDGVREAEWINLSGALANWRAAASTISRHLRPREDLFPAEAEPLKLL